MQLIFFDIETVPLPFDSFSDSQQEYLLRNAKDDAEIERRKSEMGLSPFTARIVCIGLAKATIIQKDEDFSVEKKVALCTKPTVKKAPNCVCSKKVKIKILKVSLTMKVFHIILLTKSGSSKLFGINLKKIAIVRLFPSTEGILMHRF